jgi:carbamoyl-phosphate synthase large subunit
MRDIKVLITGGGAPGAPSVIKSIREIKDRKVTIIGIDCDEQNSVGRALLDKFIIGPHSSNKDFIPIVLDICIREKVDVVLPLVTNELFLFAQAKELFKKNNIAISVSDYEPLLIANNKFALMDFCQKNDIPAPKFYLVNTWEQFEDALAKLNFPDNKVCFKPPLSNGMRGFRVIHSNKKAQVNERLDTLLNEKPNDVSITYDHFKAIIAESNYFPELLVMEYLPGEEISVDVMVCKGAMNAAVPRTRDKIKMGISFAGTTIMDDQIIQYSRRIVEGLKLDGNIGLQFKRDVNGIPKIIESNPRIQGTIILSVAAGNNMINNAVRNALDETVIDYETIWNTRMIRYWEELFIYPESARE